MVYLKTIMLLFKTLTIVTDQVIDTIMVVTLLIMQEYWFAVVYLMVDLLPAAIIMWQKFQNDRNWSFWVCLFFCQYLFFCFSESKCFNELDNINTAKYMKH
jgi:hypothetical protein